MNALVGNVADDDHLVITMSHDRANHHGTRLLLMVSDGDMSEQHLWVVQSTRYAPIVQRGGVKCGRGVYFTRFRLSPFEAADQQGVHTFLAIVRYLSFSAQHNNERKEKKTQRKLPTSDCFSASFFVAMNDVK